MHVNGFLTANYVDIGHTERHDNRMALSALKRLYGIERLICTPLMVKLTSIAPMSIGCAVDGDSAHLKACRMDFDSESTNSSSR